MGHLAKTGRKALQGEFCYYAWVRARSAADPRLGKRGSVVLRRVLCIGKKGDRECPVKLEHALAGLRQLQLQVVRAAAADLGQDRRQHDRVAADRLRLAPVADLQPQPRGL